VAEISQMGSGPITRTEWAERLLRTQVLTGQLKPGEWLKLSDLMERYEGLSPTPLREALSRLAGSGLVELLPNRGVRVARASREELLDVYENRERLEILAFERSLEAADEEWFSAIQAALDDLGRLSIASEDMVDSGRRMPLEELLRWEEAHRRFHHTLIERCGSPWLLRLVGVLYEHSVRYRFLTLQTPGSFMGAQHSHEEIFELVPKGDRRGAVAHLRRHMRLTIDAIEELPSDGEP
jgi:DNA-binding GntR family transcriptional regulator